MAGGTAPGLVCTVTTVKDSLPNVTDFVDRNLAAGADHMFVFLDDADQAIYDSLAAHEHVTPVRTGPAYWQGKRPRSLNERQVTNANLTNAVLCAVPDARWLFHIDGDECLYVDKQALLALDPDVPVVRLTTWEAVSRFSWPGPVTHFKRPLTHDDLCLLTLLGVIDLPRMKGYFRGHVSKIGMRPTLERRLRIHLVKDGAGSRVEPLEVPWLNVLHYESYSGEEFVRKWTALLSSGGASQRGQKDQFRAALNAVVTNPHLDEAGKQDVLTELYERLIEDDFGTLLDLGFLTTPDPARTRYEPQPFGDEDRATVLRMLELLCSGDKTAFGYGYDGEPPAELVRRLRRDLGRADKSLGKRLNRALAR